MKNIVESDESNEFFKCMYSELDCLFVDRASINGSDPFYIATPFENDEVVYNNPYYALYKRYIEQLLDDFYNGNPEDNGFKQLDINHVKEYQGNNSILLSRGQNKGFWEYRK